MVIAGFYTQLYTCDYTTVIPAMESKSNPYTAYLQELFLMSCLCPHDEADFL
jgi:hypothetical protein